MNRFLRPVLLLLTATCLLSLAVSSTAVAQPPDPSQEQEIIQDGESSDTTEKDAPYVPTAPSVVRKMLEAAGISEDDVVYDLGSGDGRIPIMAAKEYGARGVGIEIDPELVEKARAKAREEGVADKVEFQQGDLFEADVSEATVVTLYLWPEMNIKLRPVLLRQLNPGDQIISHNFQMGTWEPDRTIDAGRGNTGNEILYLWIVPDEVPDELLEISEELEKY